MFQIFSGDSRALTGCDVSLTCILETKGDGWGGALKIKEKKQKLFYFSPMRQTHLNSPYIWTEQFLDADKDYTPWLICNRHVIG